MEKGYFIMPEESSKNIFETTCLSQDGLGFGSGSISLDDRLNLPANDPEHISELQFAKLENFLHSPAVLVQIDSIDTQLDDDGCGDGRGVKQTFVKVGDEVQTKNRSLHRAKIFGGGPVMAGAALLATSNSNPESVEAVFLAGIDALQAHEIDFGGHTDGHATDEKSGCGAIDNGPAIVKNATKYRDEITSAIKTLGVSIEGLENVFAHFNSLAQHADGKTYVGQAVMQEIIGKHKVVKELDGNHREVAIVLNTVPNTTVNQAQIRKLTNEQLQVFAVDVWRLTDLCNRLFPDDIHQQQVGLQGMLVYTLATAATLTKGDLPVYLVQGQEALVSAQ